MDLINNNGENIHSTKVINTLIFNVIKESIKELKHDDWTELQNNEIGDISNIDSQVPSVELNTNYDEILFSENKTEKQPTLDTFVEKKSIKIDEKVKYPQKNKYNLKDKKLQYKGLKDKEQQSISRENTQGQTK